ncbi:hypothetical protein HNR01_005598 [Methylorubrum rhodesianum]|nr:hypothetical protein [Methylorubrum rhodesianum]
MIWALITRLNDVLAVIGFGTCVWGVVRLTTLINRRSRGQ